MSRAYKNRKKGRTYPAPPQICGRCGKAGCGFVPPSMGEPGFFLCEAADGIIADMKTWDNGEYWKRIQNEGSGNW